MGLVDDLVIILVLYLIVFIFSQLCAKAIERIAKSIDEKAAAVSQRRKQYKNKDEE